MQDEAKQGGLYAAMAFFTWGLVPIYWKNLQEIGFQEVLSHRILWAAVCMWLLVWWKKEIKEFLLLFKSLTKCTHWCFYFKGTFKISPLVCGHHGLYRYQYSLLSTRRKALDLHWIGGKFCVVWALKKSGSS